MEKPVKRLRGWAVKARYFTGDYFFISKDENHPLNDEPRVRYRDLVPEVGRAQLFRLKREAVAFAFRAAYTNPERVGGIIVEKVDVRVTRS